LQLGIDTSWTFADLQLRVAEEIDVAEQGTGADNRSQIPSDPSLKDRIKRAINDAAKEFASQPHRWSWLSPYLFITLSPDGTGAQNVRGDPCIYMLPANVQSAPSGVVTWRDPGNTYGGRTTDSNVDWVFGLIATSPSTVGVPRYCTVWDDAAAPMGERPRKLFVVWPKPNLAYVVKSKFRIAVPALVADSERGVWGAQHDETVMRLAVKRMMKPTEPGYAAAKLMADEAVAKSLLLDREMVGKRQSSQDVTVSRRGARSNVNNYDGTPIITY
jgi:hypothetical protein